MKPLFIRLSFPFVISIYMLLGSCSKSGSGSSTNTGGGASTVFPLSVNNTWGYKLKHYNTSTGALTDSSLFNLTITGKTTLNGTDYYEFGNSIDTTVIETIAGLNNTTLGSIDNAYGITYYTFFLSGAGDSTQSVDAWPIRVGSGGSVCEGMDKLYAHYADTTLINEDGTTFTNCMKNVIVSYDCSGNKSVANVYFIKQGLGIARFSRYIYSAGKLELQTAWVLESETLSQN